MSERSCPPSHELVTALRKGALGRDVTAHADSCHECGEIVRVTSSLQSVPLRAERVPSFTSVQWSLRARVILDGSRRRNERATRPLRVFHVGAGFGLVAAAFIITVAPLVDPTSFGGLAGLSPLPMLLPAVLGAYLMAVGRDQSRQPKHLTSPDRFGLP